MLHFSFEDEVSHFFSYHLDRKQISVEFEGFIDHSAEARKNVNCRLTISNWTHAKSRELGAEKFSDLNRNMGVFSMIQYIEEQEPGTMMFEVYMLDGRQVEFIFIEPEVNLNILST